MTRGCLLAKFRYGITTVLQGREKEVMLIQTPLTSKNPYISRISPDSFFKNVKKPWLPSTNRLCKPAAWSAIQVAMQTPSPSSFFILTHPE